MNGPLFDDEIPRQEPRDPACWVRVCTRNRFVPPLGCECIVLDAEGRFFVGARVIASKGRIAVRLLGTTTVVEFDPTTTQACPMPRHSHADRRAVIERQRRGEPARLAGPQDSPHLRRRRRADRDQT